MHSSEQCVYFSYSSLSLPPSLPLSLPLSLPPTHSLSLCLQLIAQYFPWFQLDEFEGRGDTNKGSPFDWPQLLVHDHCYASGIQVQGDMPQDSPDGREPERHHTTDGRRCVLCSVEGDAEPMVRTMSWPKGYHWFHDVLLLVL